MTGQGELFPEPELVVDDDAPDSVAAAVARSCAAAGLDPRDEGLARALLAHARSLDKWERLPKATYGTTHALPPFQAAAQALGLTPDGRTGGTSDADPADAWLRQLTAPALGDPPQS